MRSTILMHAYPYELTSYGNGIAYNLAKLDEARRASVFVQGDDATEFRHTLSALEGSFPHWPTRRILGELWEAHT